MREESRNPEFEQQQAKFNSWMDKNWKRMEITAVGSVALGVVIALISRLWPNL